MTNFMPYAHRFRWVQKNISGLATYTGNPCVYVRQLDAEIFYIGRAECLHARYKNDKLSQIIYFEEFYDKQDTVFREKQLIQEFLLCGLKIANLTHLPRKYNGRSYKYAV